MAPLARIRDSFTASVAGLPRPFWFLWAGTFITRAGSFVLPFSVGGAGMMHRVEWIASTLFAVVLVAEMYRPAARAAISDMVAPPDRIRTFGIL